MAISRRFALPVDGDATSLLTSFSEMICDARRDVFDTQLMNERLGVEFAAAWGC